jgi:ribonuclease E
VREGNLDLVLRRLVECLGRDRTRHQVAEVTSLGLVQMTRKRISIGLLEAFSHTCEHCHGRGVIIESEPVEARKPADRQGEGRAAKGGRGGRGRGGNAKPADGSPTPSQQRPSAGALPAPADVTSSDGAGHGESPIVRPPDLQQAGSADGTADGAGERVAVTGADGTADLEHDNDESAEHGRAKPPRGRRRARTSSASG